MILTKDHLKKIIKEEMGRFFEAEADADQGGDEGTAAAGEEPSKDVKRVEGKLEQYLTPVMGKINTSDELRGALTTFLNMATQNPALGASKVRLVLVDLAKQVVTKAKQAKK